MHREVVNLKDGNEIRLVVLDTDIVTFSDPVVELIDSMGGDHSIVRAARVSLKGSNEVFMGKGEKGLINYLMREHHGSPFEHTYMTFYVKAPIFVFREFHRHRMASYNEMSGRYTQLLPEFYIPAEDRPLVNAGTSARPEMVPGPLHQYEAMREDQLDVYEYAWKKYRKQIQNGVANEVARAVLPVGIFSQMYASFNLRSAFNFLSLRVRSEDAVHVSRPQRETEMVAEKIEAEVERLFPIAHAAYLKNGRVAP